MRTAVQLLTVGTAGLESRAFLYQKSWRYVNVGGWGAPHKRPIVEWRFLLAFDRPRWCSLEGARS